MTLLGWALLGALLAGAGGLLVPRLIAAVPEPEPAPVEDDKPPPPPKEPFVALAARPGLARRTALVAAAAGALVAGAVGPVAPWHLLHLLPLVVIGVALGVIDLRTRLLPKEVVAPTYALVIVGVLLVCLVTADWADLQRAALGWLVMGGFYALSWVISPRLVGYGDVRLAGVLGIALGALGWGELLIGMYAAFLVPPLTLLVAGRRLSRKARLPFGPAMLAGAVVGMLVGERLWRGYLGMITG